MAKTKICIEWCSNCETEVELPIKLGRYTCPNCGCSLINCTMCSMETECEKCNF